MFAIDDKVEVARRLVSNEARPEVTFKNPEPTPSLT